MIIRALAKRQLHKFVRRRAMASARRSALAATRAPLMREWIYSMLYDPVDGYFSKHKAPVAPMTSPTPFPCLET